MNSPALQGLNLNKPSFVKNAKLTAWVADIAALCKPDRIYWCDGSDEEYARLCQQLVDAGTMIKLDPVKAIINVQNYHHAVSQVAQTSLRSVIGQNDLDQLLSEREQVNAHLKDVIDAPTEEPWGILVERVELKDISLPESMKRSMSRQAEAERERRARVITADGEYQASTRLAEAATVMAADPAALQLRLLQTVTEVAAEKNSTLVMPFPVELLRFFDNASPAPGRVQTTAADGGETAEVPHQAADVPALTAARPPVDLAVTEHPNGARKAAVTR